MSTANSLDLYSLLPEIYRIRDAERGYPLRALLGLISGQAQLIKADIDGLWDDVFIETCAEWVIPYIGDLVANNPISEVIAQRRADVARTIYYRRRKGTLTMLEELARDVTGWDAHAVAFFEQLGWSQNLNHLRLHEDTRTASNDPFAIDRVGTALLRDLDSLDRLGGPFDSNSHTVDVRPICQLTGWHTIRKVGFFLWRLKSYFMQSVIARPSVSCAGGYHFSPLGNPAPLFTRPAKAPPDTLPVNELQVQAPIRKLAFHAQPKDYVGDALAAPSLGIAREDKVPVPSESIVCGDLSNWVLPPNGKVVVDVERGRIAFAQDIKPAENVAVVVSYAYGFSGDIGGGPYDRRSVKSVEGDTGPAIPATVADPASPGFVLGVSAETTGTISEAITAWNHAGQPPAVIQIDDSRTYREDITINMPASVSSGKPAPLLVIQAANLRRPTLIGNITIAGGAGEGEVVLNGLLVAGKVQVQGNLRLLEIVHCTLTPGMHLDEQGHPLHADLPSVLVNPTADNLQLLIDHSITGPLRLPEDMVGLTIRDSIINSPEAAAPAKLRPALVSGTLRSLSELTARPRLMVTIGTDGPYRATLQRSPSIKDDWTPALLRDALQAAIRSAHGTPAFTATRVLLAAGRLIILPGGEEKIAFIAAGKDATAAILRLDSASSRQTTALVGGPLTSFPELAVEKPALSVTIGADGPYTAALDSAPKSLAPILQPLQTVIRSSGSSPAFSSAIVARMDEQLLVVSGDGAGPITFGAVSSDSTTVKQLGLSIQIPAIAADEAGRDPGPPATLVRSTLFGNVHVRELDLASDTIFNSRVISRRRQHGCVRFSFVPPGSQTPRRYRCQPDLEIARRIERAERLASANHTNISDADRNAIRDEVLTWLRPSFTDIHYGLPGYGQLLVSCPSQIQTGAEDASEMGAFCFLKQPQRETSLRVRLREYLPFGLEPGLIYVT